MIAFPPLSSKSYQRLTMDGIKYGKPEPFYVPHYDFEPVRAIARMTEMDKYYANLLEDAFERDDEDFTFGLPPNITKRLFERCADGFDWPSWAAKIEGMGRHYKLRVSGIEDQGSIDVHFVHRKSTRPDAIPLLLVHGWPGSFLEFEQIAQILGDSYNIVMPSIPGYAFSDAPKRPSRTKGEVPWTFKKTAQCFNAIMLSLDYEKYVTQGGDWGSMLTRATSQHFPDNVKALRAPPSAETTMLQLTRPVRLELLFRSHVKAGRDRRSDRGRAARY